FHKDAKSAARGGPRADLALVVLKGEITLRSQDTTVSLEAPPKRALMVWNSLTGPSGPHALPQPPPWLADPPPLPQGVTDAARAEVVRARDQLGASPAAGIDVGLAVALKRADVAGQKLGVRCLAA